MQFTRIVIIKKLLFDYQKILEYIDENSYCSTFSPCYYHDNFAVHFAKKSNQIFYCQYFKLR